MKRRLTSLVVVAAASTVVAAALPATAATPAPPTGVSAAGVRPDPSFGPSAREAALVTAQSQAAAVRKSLGLGRSEALVAQNVERDASGAEHVHYYRTYAGLPVVGGDLVVHLAAGGGTAGVDYANEDSLAGVATKPAVPAEAATRTVAARQELRSGGVGAAHLTVWAVHSVPRLAWQVQVRGTDRSGAPVRRVEYVDAATGRYIAGWSELESADGTGRSLYGGTVPVKVIRASGAYKMKDTTRGNAITVDVANKQDPGTGYLAGKIFSDVDNSWGSGTTANRQSAAVDAQYGAAKTWDYYKSTFGRSGIRGDGAGAKSRVHYGTGFQNAFWDDGCFCMTYGDGGQFLKPLVALDVAGHEMTHGVTASTAGLIYFGESGGLNESTSDIFGTMVEFSAANAKDPGDYYLGEKIVKPAFGAPALRRMDQPASDGASYSCWTPGMGVDDVHYTSGVGNHFFYLLAEGTAVKTIGGRPHHGTSCEGDTFAGIGRDTAAAIWWRALSVYLTSTSGYIDARDATIRAARDLYASSPGTCAAVVRAWNAVDVPQGSWTCDGRLDEGASTITSNAGFESGTTDWAFGGSAVATKDPNLGFPQSGAWWAVLNGLGVANTSTVTRSVTVPSTATAALRFSLLVTTAEPYVNEHDTFDVLVNGTPVGPAGHGSNLSADDTYLRWDVPMGAYAGQTVTLRFRGVENRDAATWFLLDSVSLTPR
jgi:Zn-dependent metalloprotease